MTGSYRLNRMIQDLNGDETARARFRADAAATYRAYGITGDEQKLLADGSIEAMAQLGVHPNLQMKWIFINASRPSPVGDGPLAAYLDRLVGRDEKGTEPWDE